MKRLRTYLSVIMAVIAAAPCPSWAASKGDATVGVEVFMGDQDNAKFREYRYRTKDPIGAYTNIDLAAEPSETRFYRLGLKARTAEDVDLRTETGSYGTYKVGLGFQRFGHNFAFDAKTLYAGSGTDRLTIADSVQSYLQNTSTTPVTVLPNKLRPIVDNAASTDLFLKRDKVNMDLAWNLAKPLTFNFDANYEKRKGTRPFGGTFGFGNALEIPEPIDYDTSNFKEGIEYHTKSFFASVEHSLSVFNNANRTVTYDNPFRGVDSTANNAYSQNVLSGSKTGQSALAPDNMSNQVLATVAQNLPMHSRLTATAGMGWLRQDDKLAPVTVNTAIAGYPLTSPRSSANAKVDTRLYSLRATSNPLKKLHVKADYRYDQRDNKTPVFTINRWVVADANLYGGATPAGVSSNYVSFVERTGEIEAAYEILSKTSLSLGFENEHVNFDNGSARRENDNIYKLAVDTHKIKATDIRLALEHSNRNTDYPNYTSLELPLMRKYYAASRDQNKALVMAHYSPSDRLMTGLEYVYSIADYPESEFGLQSDLQHRAAIDAAYTVTDRITVTPSYSYERYLARQRSRQWTPAGIGDPYAAAYRAIDTFSNWTLKSHGVIHTPGLGVEAILIPEKLTATASGSYSITDGKLDFSSPLGTAANDNNAYDPLDFTNADDSSTLSVNTRFDYALHKDLSVGLGYGYYRWKIKDDLKYDGYNRMATSGTGAYNGLISMDTMYKPYNVHTVYAEASYRF